MLKKLFLITILLISSTVGLNTAYAAEGKTANDSLAAPASNNNPADSAGTSEGNNPINPSGTPGGDNPTSSPVAPAGSNPSNPSISNRGNDSIAQQGGQGADNSVYHENTASENTNQDQTTLPHVTQNQNVHGDPGAIQNQNANVIVCQQQTSVTIAVCPDKESTGSGAPANQSQSTKIAAAQQQSVASSVQVNAEQDQGTDTQSNQSQQVLLPGGDRLSQTQGTSILTGQMENAIANAQAIIMQGQLTSVLNSQNQLLKLAQSAKGEQNQATTIKEMQLQTLNTSETAKMEQTQSAEVHSVKNSEDTSVKVKTRNYLEIMQDASANVVRFVQEIMVNNVLVDVFNHDYTLNSGNPYTAQQDYQKQYDWGSLVISNSALLSFNGELQSFDATLSSILHLIVNGNIAEKPDGQNQNGGQGTSSGSNNGGSDHSSGTGKTGDSTNDASDHGTQGKTDETSKNSTEENAPAPIVVMKDKGSASDVNTSSKAQSYTAPVQNEAKPAVKNENQLPITGTNDYNFLIAGIILLFIGAGLAMFRKKLG